MGNLIAITMGDPAGIGPEIILKGFSLFEKDFVPLVIGDVEVLWFYMEKLDISVPMREVRKAEEAAENHLNVLSLTNLRPGKDFLPGRTSLACGEAVVRYIKEAVRLCTSRKACAMVTAPIAKSSMIKAGYNYPGHTELLAELTGTEKYAMMLVGGEVKTTLVTIHVALRDVPKLISVQRIVDAASLTHSFLRENWGIENPRIAVCGLNPHAGEESAFGDEEEKVIKPAVEKLRDMGILASGPHPADTVFYWHVKGRFDAVISMYHDQGLIPVKLMGFEEGVNITLGLPIIRTSPDHGTAFDIAGKNLADPKSFVSAYNLAAFFARNRLRNIA